MTINELMTGFAEKIGLVESIEIDEDGLCSFDVGDATVMVQGLDEIGVLSLSADVGEPPPERLEQLYGELLKANFNFTGTKGATLSLEPHTGKVHLCRCASYASLDADRMMMFVLDFVTVLADWRERVRNFRADDTGVERPADDGVSKMYC